MLITEVAFIATVKAEPLEVYIGGSELPQRECWTSDDSVMAGSRLSASDT